MQESAPAQMSRGGFHHSGSTAKGNCGFARLYRSSSRIIACSASPGVEAGQTIGSVGRTALLEVGQDAHLHFAVRKNGASIDPETFVD